MTNTLFSIQANLESNSFLFNGLNIGSTHYVQVFNDVGRMVKRFTINAQDQQVKCPLNLNEGKYYVTVCNEDWLHTQAFVVHPVF